MNKTADLLCIGAMLWDVIGRSPRPMAPGADLPGHVAHIPGGVALNVALAVARWGMAPAILSAVGRDSEGEALIGAVNRCGVVTDYLYREGGPTDVYMAIEDVNGLIAAIADAHSLEDAGDQILEPIRDGRLAGPGAPWRGIAVIDGNLTTDQLSRIAREPGLAEADLRIVPASPGKAERLLPLLAHPRATLYVNLEEAGLLCKTRFDNAPDAAAALLARGAARVLVTDGGRACAEGTQGAGVISDTPPPVMVTRITGAGDTFMAAHIVADQRGDTRPQALAAALRAAATYVSGEQAS